MTPAKGKKFYREEAFLMGSSTGLANRNGRTSSIASVQRVDEVAVHFQYGDAGAEARAGFLKGFRVEH